MHQAPLLLPRFQTLGLSMLLAACGGGSSPHPGQKALDISVPLDKALEACGTTGEKDEGYCAYTALESRGRLDPDSCRRVPEGRWRWECFFRAAELEMETVPLVERYRMCDLSGPYMRDCVLHVWQAEQIKVLEHFRGLPPLHEQAVKVHDRHLPLASARVKDYSDQYWRRFWGSWWSSEPFLDPAACDDLLEGEAASQCHRWVVPALGWLSLQGGTELDEVVKRYCGSTDTEHLRPRHNGPVLRPDSEALRRVLCHRDGS